MAHPSDTIRAKVVSLIKFGGTSAGQRVYDSRTQVSEADDLPNVVVFTDSDQVVEWQAMNGTMNRRTGLRIECRIKHNNEASGAQALGNLRREVELILDGDRDLDGTALYGELGDTEIEWNDDSDPPVILAKIDFFAVYLDDFSA